MPISLAEQEREAGEFFARAERRAPVNNPIVRLFLTHSCPTTTHFVFHVL